MKADFEKGTKICSKCKRELPIEKFNKDKYALDGLCVRCKQCSKVYNKICNNKRMNTFLGGAKAKRGRSSFVKRDYELTKQQLDRRNYVRKHNKYNKNVNPYGILIWYDEKLNELNRETYNKMLRNEYMNQRNCAIRGYVGRVKPSEHFLFDFDLEYMLKNNVYVCCGKCGKKYITKWWEGEIKHWTVNDGIWRN